MPNQNACATFFVLGLISMCGVLYPFWLSFSTFPVDVRVWDPTLDKLCTLPRAALSVVDRGDSAFVCLRSVDTVNSMALAANSSAFNECSLLDTFVYLQGESGGLCLAFQTKAEANGFLASVGFKDLTEEGDSASESSGRASSPSLEDSVLSDLSASVTADVMDVYEDIGDTSYDTVDTYESGAAAAEADSVPFFVDVD